MLSKRPNSNAEKSSPDNTPYFFQLSGTVAEPEMIYVKGLENIVFGDQFHIREFDSSTFADSLNKLERITHGAIRVIVAGSEDSPSTEYGYTSTESIAGNICNELRNRATQLNVSLPDWLTQTQQPQDHCKARLLTVGVTENKKEDQALVTFRYTTIKENAAYRKPSVEEKNSYVDNKVYAVKRLYQDLEANPHVDIFATREKLFINTWSKKNEVLAKKLENDPKYLAKAEEKELREIFSEECKLHYTHEVSNVNSTYQLAIDKRYLSRIQLFASQHPGHTLSFLVPPNYTPERNLTADERAQLENPVKLSASPHTLLSSLAKHAEAPATTVDITPSGCSGWKFSIGYR